MEEGPGALRRISDDAMAEIRRIFEETGGAAFFDRIEECSDRKARELGFDGANDEYVMYTYTTNSDTHH